MPLLQRTIKLVLVTVLAVGLADLLSLAYPTSAAIIAILSLSDTRRSTLKLALSRFLSMALALIIGVSVFLLFGYTLLALGLYMTFYVPLAYRFGWQIGIAPSTVLVTHLLLEQSVSRTLLANELALFLVGAGLALLANLYMPSRQDEIEHYHEVVEEQLKEVLYRFADFLRNEGGRDDSPLIEELKISLQEALQLVYLDQADHLFHQTNYHIHYFEMRQRQSDILEDMAANINGCTLAASESLILAQLFSKTAQQLSQKNPARSLLEDIDRYLALFRERPLPKTRAEFETRAMLLQLLRDLETFIQFKVDFYENHKED